VNIDLLTSVWNLPDTPWIQKVTSFQLPRVAISQIIEIPAPNEGYLKGPIQARIISAKNLVFNVDHLKIKNPGYMSNLTHVMSLSRLFSFFEEEKKSPSLPLVLHFHGGEIVFNAKVTERWLCFWKFCDA
jgi:hypothetical protein